MNNLAKWKIVKTDLFLSLEHLSYIKSLIDKLIVIVHFRYKFTEFDNGPKMG